MEGVNSLSKWVHVASHGKVPFPFGRLPTTSLCTLFLAFNLVLAVKVTMHPLRSWPDVT